MTDYAELEISLHRRDTQSYTVELRFTQPQSDSDIRLVRGDATTVQFDFARLRTLAIDPAAYGEALASSLFASPDLQSAFRQARSTAQAIDTPLRLRLFIGSGLPELHNLRWETLHDPHDHTSLLTSEHLLFSRYLSSYDWLPVRLRARAGMRALVVVANPSNLADYAPGQQQLTPFDVPGELERARSSLGDIDITELTSGITTNAITEHLRAGYDILYLVAHGALVQGEPYLWLENEHGLADVVRGEELVTRMQELRQRPRLVVLASCQSAGQGTEAAAERNAAVAALGPRLAEVGVLAVLAMQGNVSIATLERFLPVFFRELYQDGQIDRAVAVARGHVRHQRDWWMPVLYMRLKSGRIWYVPGFAEDGPGFRKWPMLLNSIRRQRCTPILGPGLAETLFGSAQEMARHWAETYHFPLQPHAREDLPQVAQFLAVNQSPNYPYDELEEYLRGELLASYDNILDEQQHTSLDHLIERVGEHQRQHTPENPHSILARLPFPIYITTSPDNLLARALAAANKQPRLVLCPWNDYIEQTFDDYDEQPTPETPLVYHLFGRFNVQESLVLTEDDYFDYLIGVTSNKELIPGVVRRALTNTSLLFLGFRMDDWHFRILFRSLMSQEGRNARSRYAHVAVQIDPEEGRTLEPEGARRYLETYFKDADISIYWGSVEDFVIELQAQRAAQEEKP